MNKLKGDKDKLLKESLGNIVSQLPGAEKVFHSYSIDYCCGGDRILLEAILEQGINKDELIEELNKALEKSVENLEVHKDWRKEDPIKLMDYILEVHHSYGMKELKSIDELLSKVLKAHYSTHGSELLAIKKVFSTLKSELEEHFIKEEEELFPLLYEYFSGNNEEEKKKIIMDTIKDTEDEHEGAGELLLEIQKLTKGYKAPEDACRSYELLYSKLEDITQDLHRHIYLENSVLFKRI